MTRRRVYLTNEEAKKANIEKSNMRMMKLYTENPEYKKKHLEEQTKRYYEKKQQFIQLKSQLTLLKSLKSKNERDEDKELKIANSESLKYNKDDIIISHGGMISGGHSEFQIIYDKNYESKEIYILM